MKPRYDYGDHVRVTRTVRNDGTFPGVDTGVELIHCGSTGYVLNVGTFLQDQIIYTVHFLDRDLQVGCREEELLPADAPWTPTQFEFRDRVTTVVALGVAGEVVIPPATTVEIVKVVRDAPGGPAYHVYHQGRTLQVPERLLSVADSEERPVETAGHLAWRSSP